MSSDGAIEAVQSELCIDGIINCGAGDLGLMIKHFNSPSSSYDITICHSQAEVTHFYQIQSNERRAGQLKQRMSNNFLPGVTLLLSR